MIRGSAARKGLKVQVTTEDGSPVVQYAEAKSTAII